MVVVCCQTPLQFISNYRKCASSNLVIYEIFVKFAYIKVLNTMIVPGAVCVPLGRLYVGPEQIAASHTVQKDIEFPLAVSRLQTTSRKSREVLSSTGPRQMPGASRGIIQCATYALTSRRDTSVFRSRCLGSRASVVCVQLRASHAHSAYSSLSHHLRTPEGNKPKRP